MTKKNLTFIPHQKSCVFTDEESVLEVALKNGLEISHSCGGMGSCTTCRVIVVEYRGQLPPRNELEQDIADMRGFQEEERLSCQLEPTDGMVLRIPEPWFDGDPST